MEDIHRSATAALEKSRDARIEDAVDFLAKVAGEGWIAVSAKLPDGALSHTAFRLPDQLDELRAWLQANEGSANLYVRPNDVGPPGQWTGQGAPLRGDATTIRCVVLDIDPDKAVEVTPGGFEAEQARVFAIADERAADMFAPCTTAVATGGGVQLWWRLAQPIAATPDTVAAVEAQTRGLIARFGGDTLPAVNGLFRIPFTTNLPDEGKRKRGRKEAVARVLHSTGATTTLADLGAYIAPPRAAAAVEAKGPVMDLDYQAVADVALDRSPLPDRLKHVIEDIDKDGALTKLVSRVDRTIKGDRSDHDYEVMSEICRRGDLTDSTELAMATFALVPEKLREKDEAGRGEYYAAHTVSKVRARRNAPSDWFTAAPAVPTAANSNLLARPGRAAVRGLVEVERLPIDRHILYPIFPVGGVLIVAGEPGISKSTLAIRWVVAVASGDETILRGHGADADAFTFESLHEAGNVLVVDGEDSLNTMQKRLQAVLLAHGMKPGEDMRHTLHLWSGSDGARLCLVERTEKGGRPRPTPEATELKAFIRAHDIKLVILGPQVGLMRGMDENDAGDVSALMDVLTGMAAKCQIAIGLIHHTGKAGRSASGDMAAGRGSFAGAAAARAYVTVTNVTGSGDEAKWGVTEKDRLIRLDVAKLTGAPRPDRPLVLRRESRLIGNHIANADAVAAMLPARAELARRGDSLPVLNLVDVEARARRAKAAAGDSQAEKAQRVASILHAVMGTADRMTLADMRAKLGPMLDDARLARGTGRGAVDRAVKEALGDGGVDLEVEGRVFTFILRRANSGKTAPYEVLRTTSDIQSRIGAPPEKGKSLAGGE